MSKGSQNQSVVKVSEMFEDLLNWKGVDSLFSSLGSVSSTLSNSVVNNPYGNYHYQPWNFTDWSVITTTYPTPTVSVPSYPVSNYSVDKNGTSVIEIAITDFEEDEILITKKDLKLVVTGNKKEKSKDDRKYFYKNIACRDFEIPFEGSDKWDFDKIEAIISKGMLTITIPVVAEWKPKNIPIKVKK